MRTTCGQKAWGQCVSFAANQSPSKPPLVLDMHLIFSTFHSIYSNFFSSRTHILLLYYAWLVGALRCAMWDAPLVRLGGLQSSGLNVCLIQSREAEGVRPHSCPLKWEDTSARQRKQAACLPLSPLNTSKLSIFTTGYRIYSVCWDACLCLLFVHLCATYISVLFLHTTSSDRGKHRHLSLLRYFYTFF